MFNKVLILPGYSNKNRIESIEVANAFNKLNFQTIRAEWRHWGDPVISWDPDYEVTRILSDLGEIDSVAIVAKSMGTVVAGKMLTELKKQGISVTSIVFAGIPVNDFDKKEARELLGNIDKSKDKLSVIANEFDEHGTAEQVLVYLGDLKPANFITQVGISTHRYNYPELITDLTLG